MKAQNTHIIKRQVLEFGTTDKERAYQLQTRFKELYYAQLLSIISDALDEFDTGKVIRIDQLVIDLGEVSLKQMDSELVQRLAGGINEKLCEIIDDEKVSRGLTGKAVEAVTPDISDFELITGFLKTGVLPWWKTTISPQELERIFKSIVRKNTGAIRSFYIQNAGNKAVVKRTVLQFSQDMAMAVVVLVANGHADATPPFIREIKRLLDGLVATGKLSEQIRTAAWQELLDLSLAMPKALRDEGGTLSSLVFVLEQVTGLGKKELIKMFFRVAYAKVAGRKADPYRVQFLDALDEAARGAMTMTELANFKRAEGIKAPKKKKRAEDSDKPEAQRKKKKTTQSENSDEAVSGANPLGPDDPASDKLSGWREKWKSIAANTAPDPVDETYVQNAGLVLIANYLPFYFKNVELLTDGVFKDEKARNRAVHLLHYIATGKDEAPEYELSLNKALCGMPLTEAVEWMDPITDKEKAQAEKMLQAAVDNWGALGKTSPLAIRQSFLGRPGMLVDESKSWILRVEDSAIDILLEKLPWSFGIINLKWMEKPIYVEWH